MTTPILHPSLLPSNAGYAPTMPTDMLSVDLYGGPPRLRKTFQNTLVAVDVQWQCTPVKYDYLQAFMRIKANNGVTPFMMGLILQTSQLQSYMCWLRNGSLQLAEQRGATYVVTATLLVRPLTDAELLDFDTGIEAMYGVYGDSLETALAALAAVPAAWPEEVV